MTAKRSGSRALIVSVILGLLALGGGAGALLVPDRSVMAALAISACVAFASMIAALISFGGRRPGASLGALAASLLIMLGIGAGFGAVSVQRFVEAVERQREHVEPHDDEDYRFRLTPPSRDVVVYSERALRDVNERAAAGMWLPDEETTVLVFVELPYDRSLEVAAREELALAIGEEAASVTQQAVRYLDHDAVRIQRTFAREAGTLCEETTFLIDRGHVYAVHASRVLPAPPATPAWFDVALDSFELLEGEVHARFDPPAVARDDGPGWRVRGSIYENGDFGVRVRGADRLLRYGDAAPAAGTDTIVAVEERHPDRTLIVRPLLTGGRDPEVVSRELRDARFGEPEALAPIVLDVSGQPVTFEARVGSPNRTWRYRCGVWTDAERAIEIAVWAPTRALADESLGELVRRVDVLDTSETRALRAELGERADPWHAVGHDWAVRGGVLTDFEEGVRWTRPDPAWSARVSDYVDDRSGFEQILVLEAPSLGLRGRVIAYDAGDTPAAAHHGQLVADYATSASDESMLEDTAGVPHRFGAAEGRVSARVQGLEHAYALGTVVGDLGALYHVEVWGTRRDFDASPGAARAAVEAFEVTARAPSARFEDGVYRDERMGYAFRSPWADAPETEWDSLGGGAGSLVHIARGDESVAIIAAVYDPAAAPEAQAAELLEDYYADVMRVPGRWRESDATLAGRSCRLRARTLPFAVGGTRVYRLVDRGVLYLLMIEDRRHTALTDAADRFSLL